MRLFSLPFAVILFSFAASAQYASAPPGYYPIDYLGDTFTGKVISTSGSLITLSYAKGRKKQSFTGAFEEGCSVPTNGAVHRKMLATDIPNGTEMMVYFIPTSKVVNGQKVKQNLIFLISFVTWKGQKVEAKYKRNYSCAENGPLALKAFDTSLDHPPF